MATQTFRHFDSLGRFSLFMLESMPFMILIGCVLGFLAGLGVGGGSLLMLWLTLVLDLDHTVARNINLLFFIPTALIASVFRWKQGSINIRSLLPAIALGCVCSLIFSKISIGIDITIIKKLFGILLLVTGLRELLYRPRKAK